MKTITLSLFTLVLVQVAQAQLSLNQFFPGNPKTVVGVSAEPLGNSAGGQNLTWDFSNLNPDGVSYQVNYMAPTQEIVNRFPGSNKAMKITEDGNDVFFAFRETQAGLEQTGLITSIDGETKASEFVNPKLYLPSNLSFGSNSTDNFYSRMDLGSPGIDFSINTGGQLRTVVDATGTIILPNGQTVTGVTRLYTAENYTDTVRLVIPGFPADPELILGRTKLYSWYKNDGSGNPLLFSLVEDSTFAEGEWTVNVSAFYLVNTTTQAGNKFQNKKNMPYPNRVENILNIPFEKADEAPEKVWVTDAVGRKVYESEMRPAQFQQNRIEISLGHLTPGTYYITSLNKNQKPQKPFRISKI